MAFGESGEGSLYEEETGEIKQVEQDPQSEQVAEVMPFLIKDFKGVIHTHTYEGSPCAEDALIRVRQAAERAGFQYITFNEHPDYVIVESWPEKIRQEFANINQLNNEPGPRMFKGVEVNILKDGTIETPEDILDDSDCVVASLHYYFTHRPEECTAEATTELYCSIMEKYPQVSMIGHPLRDLPKEEWEKVDWDKICALAKEKNVAIELSVSHQQDEDLPENFYRALEEHQNLVEISPDFHSIQRYFLKKDNIDEVGSQFSVEEKALFSEYIKLKRRIGEATFNEGENLSNRGLGKPERTAEEKATRIEELRANRKRLQEILETGKIEEMYDIMLASEPDYVEVKNREGQIERRKVNRNPIPIENLMSVMRKVRRLQKKKSFRDPSKPLFDPARVINLWSADQFFKWTKERKGEQTEI